MNKWILRITVLFSCVSLVLSIWAIWRVEPITLSESWLAWAIGVSVSMISVGIVAVFGYQIYNSATLDKRMKNMFEEKTEKVREDLAISGARSMAAVLYQAEGVSLKLDVATDSFESAVKTLKARLGYAISLSEAERISEIAGIIVNTRIILLQRDINNDSLDNSFLELAQVASAHLSASDVQASRLLEMISQIQSGKSSAAPPRQ